MWQQPALVSDIGLVWRIHTRIYSSVAPHKNCAGVGDRMRPVESLFLLYVAGAGVALWRTDGNAATRIRLAVLWPLGVIAAAVTTMILLLAAAILFPLFGIALGASLIGGWWLVS